MAHSSRTLGAPSTAIDRLREIKAEGAHLLPQKPGLWIDDSENLRLIEALAERLHLPKHRIVKDAIARLAFSLDQGDRAIRDRDASDA